jgi:ubiquinone/menaquinone biosynthesis C-methylase UbiE
MTSRPKNWLDWWETENIVAEATWHNNMEIFVTASHSLLHYNSQDIILDIGSGPGYLAAFLKDRVKEIYCLDTSSRYLDLCRDKFAKDRNVFINQLDKNNYTDLSLLNNKKFSIIICQSVIQYYKSINEVEHLIEEVRRAALPGARFLITDIPTTNNVMLLTYGLVKTAFRKGRISEISKLLFKIATSKYGKAYSSLRLLAISDGELKELIDKLGLDAKVLSINLTCNEHRRHLLVRF